jgi:hypothetical protein
MVFAAHGRLLNARLPGRDRRLLRGVTRVVVTVCLFALIGREAAAQIQTGPPIVGFFTGTDNGYTTPSPPRDSYRCLVCVDGAERRGLRHYFGILQSDRTGLIHT